MKILTTLICLAALARQALADQPQPPNLPTVLPTATPVYSCQPTEYAISGKGEGAVPTRCRPQVIMLVDGRLLTLKGESIPIQNQESSRVQPLKIKVEERP